MGTRIKIDNPAHLQQTLEGEGVFVGQWDSPAALEALFTEIREGECELQASPLERWLRIVRLALVSKRTGMFLVEESVQYADGRFQQRGRLLSEKIIGGENPIDCAKRAVAEELSVASLSGLEILGVSEPSIEYRLSTPSYPGLRSRYEIYDVSATIEGLPSTGFSTEESDADELVATHRWCWAKQKPKAQNNHSARIGNEPENDRQ
ncbi:hypothetical protein P4C99_19830 [Pontiellaceae bacterium B1224]|nr:hypothetical protein [Pontiellaceae bacterium B1224]